MRGRKVAASLRCPNSVLGGFPVPWERPETEERPAVSCLDRRQHPRCRSSRPLHRRLPDVRHAARQPGGQRDRRSGGAGQVSARRRRRPQMVLQRAAAAAQPAARSTPNGSACSTTSRTTTSAAWSSARPTCSRRGTRPSPAIPASTSSCATRRACSISTIRPTARPRPPYRYMPDATQPTWLVTNQMGWRGAPIEVPRGAQDHPHRVRRLLDHRRPAAPALLLSRAGRLLAEPLGRVARSCRCTSRC